NTSAHLKKDRSRMQRGACNKTILPRRVVGRVTPCAPLCCKRTARTECCALPAEGAFVHFVVAPFTASSRPWFSNPFRESFSRRTLPTGARRTVFEPPHGLRRA